MLVWVMAYTSYSFNYIDFFIFYYLTLLTDTTNLIPYDIRTKFKYQ